MADPEIPLRDKLARLAGKAEFLPDGSRRLTARGEPGALAALLAEVDDTVLLAGLQFETGGERLTLVVAGRRILSISGASDGLRVDEELIGSPLDPEDEVSVAAVQQILDRFTAPADQLLVTVGQAARSGTEADLGLSPAQFAVPEETASSRSVLGRIAVGISAPAMVLLKNGEITAAEGPAGLRQALEAVLDQQLVDFDEARFAASDGHVDPSLTCICGVMPDDFAIAMAVVNAEIGLYAVPIEDIPRLHSLWRVSSD